MNLILLLFWNNWAVMTDDSTEIYSNLLLRVFFHISMDQSNTKLEVLYFVGSALKRLKYCENYLNLLQFPNSKKNSFRGNNMRKYGIYSGIYNV